jgi:S1-C subfamily serine protease
VGTLVASVGVRKEDAMAIGTIYRAAHPAPPEPGRLPVGKLRDVKGGVEIYDATELEAGFRLRGIHFPFQEGDVITHVENRPTPDSHALLELAKEFETTAPLVVAGDRVHVRVLRDRRPLELDFPLPSSSRASSNGAFTCASCRRSGFSSVLDSDMSIAVGSFGGPVIDDSGRVIGIVIAPSAYDGLVYLLPAAIAEKASKELKPR